MHNNRFPTLYTQSKIFDRSELLIKGRKVNQMHLVKVVKSLQVESTRLESASWGFLIAIDL